MKSLTSGLVVEEPTLGTPAPLKVRDFVTLHPISPFVDEDATFFIVAEVEPILTILSSTGNVFYIRRWEVIKEEEPKEALPCR